MATGMGRAFFAGVGSTFIILAFGFGSGLMMATSAPKEPSNYQTRAANIALAPVRIILPNSAEAAQPPQQSEPLVQAQKPAIPPTKHALTLVDREVQKDETRKTEAEERQRTRRYAERKAKLQAARARQQRELRQEAPVMAFGADNSPRFGGDLFNAR